MINIKILFIYLIFIIFLLMQSLTIFAQPTNMTPVDQVVSGIKTTSTGTTKYISINGGNPYWDATMPSIRVYAVGNDVDVDVYLQYYDGYWDEFPGYYSNSYGNGNWDFERVTVDDDDGYLIWGYKLRWEIITYSGSGTITYSINHNVLFFAHQTNGSPGDGDPNWEKEHKRSAVSLYNELKDYNDTYQCFLMDNSTTGRFDGSTTEKNWLKARFSFPRLAMYDCVVFSNTYGDPIPTANKLDGVNCRANFEKYIKEIGGGYVGHHAAQDAFYGNRVISGSSSWNFYLNDLTGGCHYGGHPGNSGTTGTVYIFEPYHPINLYTYGYPETRKEEWYQYEPNDSPEPTSTFNVIHELSVPGQDRADGAAPDTGKQAICWYGTYDGTGECPGWPFGEGRSVCMGYGHGPNSKQGDPWKEYWTFERMLFSIGWAGQINSYWYEY